MAMKATTARPAKSRTRDDWLARAHEARVKAAQLGDANSRALMLTIAEDYELLAAHADPAPQAMRLTSLAKEAAARATEGERHLAKQRALIATLKREGHDTREAESLLQTFEEAQLLHVDHRDRLQQEAAIAVQAVTGAAAAKPGLRPTRGRRHNPR